MYLIFQLHYLFEHVDEYVGRDCDGTGEGLGRYSEQAAESIHADFKKHWDNYKVLDWKSEVYGDQIFAATVSYNGMHI
jgi:hypothetical protein